MTKVNLRKQDLERTRQDILTVATELFMDKGFKSTSTREIAERCGITQPNLYHHFKNKKELYLAVITQLTDRVQADLSLIVEKNLSTEEKLSEMIEVLLEKHPTNFFLMLHDMFAEMDAADHGHLYQVFKQTYIQPIATVFQDKNTEFILRSDVTTEEASRFVLHNVSAILSIQTTYQRETSKKDISRYIQLMLYGIGEKIPNK